MLPSLSVIIPHLNQEHSLANCLASLKAQVRDDPSVEIVVVDNGSANLPTEVVRGYVGASLDIELTPGPGPARNKGARLSTGEILAFIDADCVPHHGWINTIRKEFAEKRDTEIIGGDVRIKPLDPTQLTDVEAYESIYAFRQKEYIERMGFSGTGNLAMLRKIYNEVGPFAGIGVAEDRDWGRRAKALGHSTKYVPEMIVFHPARSNLTELLRKWDRQTAHDYQFYATRRVGTLRWLLRAGALAISPLAEVFIIAFSSRVSGLRARVGAGRTLIQVRTHRSKRMVEMLFRYESTTADTWNRQL